MKRQLIKMRADWPTGAHALEESLHWGSCIRLNKLSAKRPYARIGNLGWDTDSAVLTQRARQVLEEAGMSSDKYSHIAAAVGRQGKGSAVEIHFAYEITHTSYSAGCAALRFTGMSCLSLGNAACHSCLIMTQ